MWQMAVVPGGATAQQQLSQAAALAAMLGAAMPGMAAAERQPLPAVLSVNDRQAYVEDLQQPPPGYVLARRWMRNEPEVDADSLPPQANALMLLPRPAPAPAAADEPPVFPDDSEDYDPDEAVRALKRHWVSTRQYDTAQRTARLARYEERLRVLGTMSAAAPASISAAVTQLLGSQQQPAAMAVQQQLAPSVVQLPAAAALQVALAAMPPPPPPQQQQQQQPPVDAAEAAGAAAAAATSQLPHPQEQPQELAQAGQEQVQEQANEPSPLPAQQQQQQGQQQEYQAAEAAADGVQPMVEG